MKHAAISFIIISPLILGLSGDYRSPAILYAQDTQEMQQPDEKSSDPKKPESSDVRSLPSEAPEKKGDAAPPVSPNASAEKKGPSLPQGEADSKPGKKQKAPSKKESAVPADKIRKSAPDTQAEKSGEGAAKDAAAILISPSYPTEQISFEGWLDAMSYREIKNWARTYGLKALRPQGAIEGTRASFVSKHGSKVIITNLDPLRHYYLWVRFVNYAKLTDTDINAFLKIHADKEHIAHFSFADVMEKAEPLVFEIPCHHTMDGKLTLEFREYSSRGGFFGIWNMALSDSIEQPQILIPQPNTAKMVEPDSLIDKTEPKPHSRIEKGDKATAPSTPADDTIPSPSPKNIVPPEKSSGKDIRLQKPDTKSKKPIGKAAAKQAGKSNLEKSDTKIGQKKEAAARKMLKDDRKKDVRAQ